MGEFSETIKGGDYRKSLEAMRDELAKGMEEADPNVKPQYAARLQAVLEVLSELPSREKSPVDELVERRTNRRATADSELRARQRRGSKSGA